jgi:hypothetical protein
MSLSVKRVNLVVIYHWVNTFLSFLSHLADRQAFEPAVILIIELPSGDADSP